MKSSIRKGFGFGLTSGIIATLGMMIGLDQGTHSASVVLAGILLIAITDALSDAVAIFMADEAELQTQSSIWQEALSTFFSKFLIGALFAIPVILIDLRQALILSVSFGLILIVTISYFIAKNEKRPVLKIVLGHLGVTIAVILVSGFVGRIAENIKEHNFFLRL